MKNPFVIALGLFPLLATSTALAQDVSLTAEKDVPSFATLDRGDATSKVGMSASMTFFDSTEPVTALRFDLHGQYVHKKGYGVYGSLPLSHLSTDLGLFGGDYSEMALGNLELGGLYNRKLSDKLLLTVRGGVMLPTADNGAGMFANAFNALPRTTDVGSIAPDTTIVRASASVTGKQGIGFYRADAGFDLPIDTPDGMSSDLLMRLNLGAGVHAGPVALMGELVTVGTTGDVAADDNRFRHTAALTAMLTSNKQIQPTISLVLPLNSPPNDIIRASVMLGVQGRLP